MRPTTIDAIELSIEAKMTRLRGRHDKVIFQYDNARPRAAKPIKETLNWDVLAHRILQILLLPITIYFDR